MGLPSPAGQDARKAARQSEGAIVNRGSWGLDSRSGPSLGRLEVHSRPLDQRRSCP